MEDIQKRQQNFSVNFYLVLEKENKDSLNSPDYEEGDAFEEKVIFSKNPTTGDNIGFYIALAIISFVFLIFILKKTSMKKVKKNSLGLFVLFAVLYIVFMPQIAKSLEGLTFNVMFENYSELKDKLLITYDVDGTLNTKVIPYDTKVPLDDPYKEGYIFKGWYNDDGTLFDLNTSIKEDINLTAIFEADVYDILYNLNGGEVENPDSYTIEEEVQINNPSKTGYTFEGWSGTDLSELTKNLVIFKGSIGARSYEAHWVANEYTVIFDKNTGEGAMNSITAYYDTPRYLPVNEFSKEDAKFLYWNTQPDGSGISYNNESYIKNLVSEGEITLYAQWISQSEWAMFKDGRWVNAQMKQIAGNDGATYGTVDNNILSIERSVAPAPSTATTISVKSIYSPSPLDMWYDSANRTIYYYSTAKYIYLNSDSQSFFSYFHALTNIDYDGFRTDDVTNMFGMFAQTKSLTNVDLRNFNTAKVTNMDSMFNQCNAETNIDVSNFDTRNVKNMRRMFTACEHVTYLDLSKFNTSNVTDMTKMFDYLPLIETINVSHFNTQNVTTMEGMFRDCPRLKTLDLSSFDTKNVTNMAGMFGCSDSNPPRVEFSGLTSITINTNNFNTSKVTSMKQMFFKCSKLKSFDFSGFDTSNVTDISGMFSQRHSITGLDLSGFNTSKVTNMSSMFNNCNSMVSINVSNFDTRNVKNMNRMFSSCRALLALDVSSFSNTENILNDMTKMFDNMVSLTTIYASDNFLTDSVTSGSDVFKNDASLVGGNGTVCNGVQRTGYTYARIDGGELLPGYFTRKV